jgi:hypothetical protein
MKTLTLLLTLFLINCNADTNIETRFLPVDDPVITEPPPEPPITDNKIKLSLINNGTAILYDNTNFIIWDTGNIKYAGPRKISKDDILYTLNEYGQTLSTKQLITTPDHIIDDYVIENIPPADALAMGAMFKGYTRIYQNNTEIGQWFMNDWKTEKLIKTFSGDVIAVQSTGAMHHINGSETGIFHADILFIYDYDAIAKTAKLKYNGVHDIFWIENFMSSARYWQESDGVFYSNNGHAWTSAWLVEQATDLYSFNFTPYGIIVPNGEFAYVISAGTRIENSETVLYWLECNSGWIFRYVPSIDLLEMKYRLYQGDGMRVTGLAYGKTVNPVIIENDLYFNDSNTVFKLDLDNGNISSFYSGNYKVRRW